MSEVDFADPASLWPEPPDGFDDAPAGPADGVWVWELLDPDERKARLEFLSAWVAWLVENFTLQGTLPQCWFRHHPVRHHLTALYLGWVRTYIQRNDKEARDLAEAEWLATFRQFKPELQVPGCISAGKHVDTPVRPWHTSIDELRDWFEQSDWGQVEPYNPAEPLDLPDHGEQP